MGVLFLLQVCSNVDVYGVDPPAADGTAAGAGDSGGGGGGGDGGGGGGGGGSDEEGGGLRPAQPWRHRYYSRPKDKPPAGHDLRERDVEYGALRALHARRLITLCATEHAARCAQMTPRNARGVVVRGGVKW
jgi:hypothetical protein